MADTSILEVARSNHEEAERYESALVDLLLTSNPNKSSDQLYKSHKASILLDRIAQRNASLLDFYKDNTGERKRELVFLNPNHGNHKEDGGQEGKDSNAAASAAAAASSSNFNQSSNPINSSTFEEFYSRLNKIKDYHSKYPSLEPVSFTNQLTIPNNAEIGLERKFSGEESNGRYLDLYQHHERYLNLKGVKKLSYLNYLDKFDRLKGDEDEEGRILSRETKKGEAYKTYLSELSAYLLSFLRLTRPLEDIDGMESHAESEFEKSWESGQVPGWESDIKSIRQGGESNADSSEGIWCQACNKSFAKQTVYDAHLKGGKHQKAAARLASNPTTSSSTNPNLESSKSTSNDDKTKKLNRIKNLASLENLISITSQELLAVRNETRSNVERRSALTEKERIAEAEAIEEDQNSNGIRNGMTQEELEGRDDDEDDEKIYNPLKLPLGWDGKPIPFWLYKLHGLGVEFKCEICSDYVYQGRKNFDRHFQEARHAFGMRALGLPNSKQFHEITKIEDALALAEKLKRQGKVAAEEEGDAEEVEDEQGNTYTRKTYELLKRQGLI